MAHDQQPDEDDKLRDGKGRYTRSIESVRRDAEAADLRSERKSYQQIAEALGYSDKGEAWRGVQRAKADVAREPVTRLIRSEAAQLDDLYVSALEVLERDHIMVSHGKIVKDDDGNPLLDDGPKLAAIRELRTIRESYRKLFGADAPSRVSVDAQQLGAEISALFDRVADDDGAAGDDGTDG
ncbi:hypothetical protein [Streptomyces sp. wa1063]|uniref:hypothetical protein n=1 Tax=Streptomyces sp. wa1063 TaxID=1828212 RepID=UPI000BF02211|nr:hypothetical protein [Streptomyces sp. wa1063]